MNPIVEEKIVESIILDDSDAAHNGAAWLDDTLPEWYKYIDVDMLDIADSTYCIVGQLENQGYDLGTGYDSDKGFDCSVDREDSNYTELNDAWRHEIHVRQARD